MIIFVFLPSQAQEVPSPPGERRQHSLNFQSYSTGVGLVNSVLDKIYRVRHEGEAVVLQDRANQMEGNKMAASPLKPNLNHTAQCLPTLI